MEQLKFGGFPPLIKKNKNIQKDQKELKPQYFSQVNRQNINIREILNQKNTSVITTSDDKLEEIDNL